MQKAQNPASFQKQGFIIYSWHHPYEKGSILLLTD